MRKKILTISISFFVGALLTFIFCLLLFPKTNSEYNASLATERSSNGQETIQIAYENINFQSGIWEPKDWNNPYATYQGDAVPNEQVAVSIACDILYNLEWGNTVCYTVPNSVFFDEQDEIWIVSFCMRDQETGLEVLGGGYFVAIQKSDGKILRIFADQ